MNRHSGQVTNGKLRPVTARAFRRAAHALCDTSVSTCGQQVSPASNWHRKRHLSFGLTGEAFSWARLLRPLHHVLAEAEITQPFLYWAEDASEPLKFKHPKATSGFSLLYHFLRSESCGLKVRTRVYLVSRHLSAETTENPV